LEQPGQRYRPPCRIGQAHSDGLGAQRPIQEGATVTKFPIVSVVISTYNRPQLLDRALASVYAQTFTNYEVIVVDDATPDSDTLKAMLSRWKTKFFEAGINLLPCYMEVNSGTQ